MVFPCEALPNCHHDMMAECNRTAPSMKTLTLLGSTGSIGTNTLDVVRRNRHQYQVYALAAGQNVDLLASQIRGIPSQSCSRGNVRRSAPPHRSALGGAGLSRSEWPELLSGDAARVSRHGRRVRYGNFGDRGGGWFGGHLPSRSGRGKRIGLANKEVLVSGGKLVMEAVRESRSRAGADR